MLQGWYLASSSRCKRYIRMLVAVLFLVFSTAWLLAGGIRRYALKTGMLDLPNSRSSHHLPTPRGGGLAFVLSFFLSLPFLKGMDLVDLPLLIALTVSGSLIAILGFIDDYRQLSAHVRLLGHLIAAIFALYCVGGMPAVHILGAWSLPGGLIGGIFAVLYLGWMLNLYNFMDGIDGLAACEGFSVCIGGGFLYFLNGNNSKLYLLLMLATAVLGFLVWNFPKARLFMGDAGSGFLGFCIGLLSLQAATVASNLFWSWLILSAVFIIDATLTLIRRGVQGQPLSQAHRNHAYQHAALYYKTHVVVTIAVFCINLFWLLPWAIVVSKGYINGVGGLTIAYFPLIILALKFQAGKKEKEIVIFEEQSKREIKFNN